MNTKLPIYMSCVFFTSHSIFYAMHKTTTHRTNLADFDLAADDVSVELTSPHPPRSSALTYLLKTSPIKPLEKPIPNQTDLDKKGVWFSAIQKNDVQTLSIMIFQGFDLNARHEDGETGLMKAVKYDFVETVEYLLSCGAKKDDHDKQGHSLEDLTASDEIKSELHGIPIPGSATALLSVSRLRHRR